MTKGAALINAISIHSLMVQFGSFETVCFDIYNAGQECIVYGHYYPSKVSLYVLEIRFKLYAIADATCENRSIEGSSMCVFSISWHWDN